MELRAHLLKRLSEKGGHIGPNLGSLEFTVALHYVFDSPKDKIVFDVSHQTYVHKMLTGRNDAFMIRDILLLKKVNMISLLSGILQLQ